MHFLRSLPKSSIEMYEIYDRCNILPMKGYTMALLGNYCSLFFIIIITLFSPVYPLFERSDLMSERSEPMDIDLFLKSQNPLQPHTSMASFLKSSTQSDDDEKSVEAFHQLPIQQVDASTQTEDSSLKITLAIALQPPQHYLKTFQPEPCIPFLESTFFLSL
jgi:hypothetical protein